MARPSIKSPCVADAHHRQPHERIAEVYWPSLPDAADNPKAEAAGSLVSIARASDGTPTLDVYSTDPTVRVRAPLANLDVTVTPEMVMAALSAFVASDGGVTPVMYRPTTHTMRAAILAALGRKD